MQYPGTFAPFYYGLLRKDDGDNNGIFSDLPDIWFTYNNEVIANCPSLNAIYIDLVNESEACIWPVLYLATIPCDHV